MHMSFTGERFVPELRGQIYYEHFHRYAVCLPIAAGKDVLDIASGEGYGAAFLAMSARSVVGVDVDADSVQHAAARYPAMNLSFRVGSAAQIPLTDRSIDVITSFETIEHLTEHDQMLREFDRVLRPDGCLIISSPNKLVYSDERGYSNPYHVRELYFHEFRELLQHHFAEVRMYGQRIFAASSVYPIGQNASKTRWVGPSSSSDQGMPGLPAPEYFLAVCARSSDAKLYDVATVYLDPRDDLLVDIRGGGLASDIEQQPQALPGDSGPIALGDGGAPQKSADQLHIDALEEQLAEQKLATDANALEVERLQKQCLELEQLRAEQFERAARAEAERMVTNAQREASDARREAAERERDAAERERDAAERERRRREAEIQLMRDRHAEELQEVTERYGAELNAARNEFDRIQARANDIGTELLVVRLAQSEAALVEALNAGDEARSELESLRRSHSWQFTAPLRKASSLISQRS